MTLREEILYKINTGTYELGMGWAFEGVDEEDDPELYEAMLKFDSWLYSLDKDE